MRELAPRGAEQLPSADVSCHLPPRSSRTGGALPFPGSHSSIEPSPGDPDIREKAKLPHNSETNTHIHELNI